MSALQSQHQVSTYQLELAELLEVDDGNGTRWGLNLGFGKGDELEIS